MSPSTGAQWGSMKREVIEVDGAQRSTGSSPAISRLSLSMLS